VWVIAETTGLGTKRYAKIVVTHDQGRYLLPALPSGAQYNVWVRGFGLVDSRRVAAKPGMTLNLAAVVAPSAQAAAQYYSGSYWWSMLEVPDKTRFPGTGPKGNGTSAELKSQADWIDGIKQNGCGNCHQAGGPAMRFLDRAALGVGEKDTAAAAWTARLRMGQAGGAMMAGVSSLMTNDGGLLARLARWTDRIAAGEVPTQKPDRPQGVERNIVVTLWDWSRPTAYLHDLIGTDRRKPTVNGWGALYGAMELSTDWVPILDPVLHTATETKMPVKSASTPRSSTVNVAPAPWHYWGDRVLWDTQVNAHTNMMDGEGRVWWTATHRPQWEQPAFCQKGSDHPSAKAFPLQRASGAVTATGFVQNARGVTMYDPKTKQWAFVDTCFGTHHLNFGYDADNTLYLANNGGPEVGWVNTRVFLETGDSAKAQGWTPFIIDTNGNGTRDAYVEPDAPVDPSRDKRVNLGFYGIAVNKNDGTVWGSNTAGRGWIVRVDLGANPPVTALTEAYQLPAGELGIRGMDLDSRGIAWAAGAGGNLISFDRSKCRIRNGPTATGDHCPDGFRLYPLPGPKFDGVERPLGTVASPYYVWVDIHDILGLGRDTVIVLDNQSDGVQAFTNGKWTHLAIPYPMGFFSKGFEGRIDDPNGGWSARGLWATWGGRAPWHSEGARGTPPYAVQLQLRPNPLANAN
jgi:hypothetical protein